MADNNDELDLKDKEDDTSSDQSSADKNDSAADDGLKNGSGESNSEKADRLLADGTSSNKEIKVNKKTYDEKNEKAKLYETHALLIDRVLKDPELVENLLETKERGNLDDRLSRLEEKEKADKRQEIKDVMTEALSTWPDLEGLWEEVQPVVESLTKRGVNYRDALRRGYFAINPDAAAVEKDRLAKEGVNKLGTFSSSFGSRATRPVSSNDNPKLNDNEKRIAKALGKSEEEYGSLLEKHANWLNVKGFNVPLD